MWGSDWPVCRLRAEYSEWVNNAQNLTNNLSVKQKNVFVKMQLNFMVLR
jgi:L-fuconolactonase